MSDLSVLMPYYNSREYLDRLFDSIISQDAGKIQLICIDDGSTDDSFSVIEAYRVKIKPDWEMVNLHTDHAGQAAAISKGLPYIDSELFTWIDSDDILMDGFFSERIRFFEENPEYQMLRNNILADKTASGDGQQLLFTGELAKERDDLFFGMFSNRFPTAGAGIYTIRTKDFFDIYKDKSIPFSTVGQNLQMILPPLSRLKCGYIDKDLYHYIQRADSHSNSGKNITEIMDRINAFYDLLCRLIPYCDYDSEKLRAAAEAYRSHERAFYLSKAAAMGRRGKG